VVSIVHVASPSDWVQAIELIDEYAASLFVGLDFQDFGDERAHLSEHYGPPDGLFLLAREGPTALGCGGVRRFSDACCEMKRLYVRPDGRGRGIGKMLVTTLIAKARNLGYTSMMLDTLPSMKAAQTLYRSLGFVHVPPHRYNPIDGAVFLKLDLT
jgi:GNAT superfamily N-acetyltransferase